MEQKVVGVIVEQVKKDMVLVKEVHTGKEIFVMDKEAAAYQRGNLLTVDLATKKIVDEAENYPFV